MPTFPATNLSNSNSPVRDIEAVLAGTLALMTVYAQTCCARQAAMLAQKIVSNLESLGEHAQLSTNFQTVLRGLQGRWVHEVNEIGALAGSPAGVGRVDYEVEHPMQLAPNMVH